MDRDIPQLPFPSSATQETHTVSYHPEAAHPWWVWHIPTNTVVMAFATKQMARSVAAIRNLRDAKPGAQVRNRDTGQVATVIFVWPGSIEVLLPGGKYRRWAFTHTELVTGAGDTVPVTPRSIRRLIDAKSSKKGASHE